MAMIPTTLRSAASLLALALVLASCSSAQDAAPPGTLVVRDSLPGSVGALGNVVELADGRVMYTDTRDRYFLRGDFAARDVDTLGVRLEGGPNIPMVEGGYKLPGQVARLGGDTVALVDYAAILTTLWGPDGTFRGALALPEVGGPTPVLHYDATGHGFKVDYAAVLGGNEPGSRIRPDSIPLLRLALAGGPVDTVGFLSAPEYGQAFVGPQGQEVPLIFGPTDAFGALPDGSVWIARARTLSLDWRGPDGRWQRGKKHTWTPVPVTDADTFQVMTRLRDRGLPTGVKVAFPFAQTKPSFELAVGDPAGDVWLQYSRAADSLPLRYAVFGRDGRKRRDVAAPPGVAVAGFGANGAVYGARRTAEGRREVVVMDVR